MSILLLAGCAQLGKPAWPMASRDGAATQSNSPAGPAAQIHLALANSAEKRGDSMGAMAAYTEALKTDPNLALAYHRLALLHDRLGDNQVANGLYREAIARAPQAPELYCDLGYNCYLLGRLDEAEQHLRHSLELRPTFVRAHNNLALLLARSGRVEEAVHQFARSGATEAHARSNLALALMLEGNVTDAQAQLAVARQLDPTDNATVAELQSIARRASQVRRLPRTDGE